MRLVSGAENGQAYLWDLNQTEGNGKYEQIYEITPGASSDRTQIGSSHIGGNGWTSMTWSSDGNCLAGVREQSKGKVTLTHIKKVVEFKGQKFVKYMSINILILLLFSKKKFHLLHHISGKLHEH